MDRSIPPDFEKIAKALADSHRLKILDALKEKQLVCGDLLELLELSQPTVSHHVKILVDSGLVQAKKEGRCLRLSLNSATFQDFLKQLEYFVA